MMIPASFRSMMAIAAVVFLVLASCRKDSGPTSDKPAGSLLFDEGSPEAREALTTPVNFRITDANYAQWEQAQRFLDALPNSAFASGSGGRGSAIDRAIAKLEASPRARTAIERTGLTVRDFVLETIALAQAAEAETGRTTAGVTIPDGNLQFLQRYRSRVQGRREAVADRDRGDPRAEADTTNVGAQQTTDMAPEVQQPEDQQAQVRASDSASVKQRDSLRRDVQPAKQPAKAGGDTVRDTIPAPILR